MSPTNYLYRNIPLSPLKQQLFAGGIIGLIVFFILWVFQPFGTYEFSMTNKGLFLFGYGIINSLCYMFFYTIGHLLIPNWFKPSRWNIMKEASCLILVLQLMTFACLIYHHQIIGNYTLSLSTYLNFLKYSISVAVVPFSVLYYQKWIHFRLIQRSSFTNGIEENKLQTITFESNNKNESSITIPENEILFIKSEGNYIEVIQWNQQKHKRYLIRNTLNNIHSVLPEKSFCKIHRSFLVNLNFADRLTLNGSIYELSLTASEQKLPVSRSMVKELKQYMQDRR